MRKLQIIHVKLSASRDNDKRHYFSSMWQRIFLSFCMMLLVSLPEMDSEGEGLRASAICLMFGAAPSDAGVSDAGVSW